MRHVSEWIELHRQGIGLAFAVSLAMPGVGLPLQAQAQVASPSAITVLVGRPAGLGLAYWRGIKGPSFFFLRWEGTLLLTRSQFAGGGLGVGSDPTRDVAVNATAMVGASRCRRTAYGEKGCGQDQPWMATYGASAGVRLRLGTRWSFGIETGRRDTFGTPAEARYVRDTLFYFTITHWLD